MIYLVGLGLTKAEFILLKKLNQAVAIDQFDWPGQGVAGRIYGCVREVAGGEKNPFFGTRTSH